MLSPFGGTSPKDVAETLPDIGTLGRDVTKRHCRDIARQGHHQKTLQRRRQTLAPWGGTSPKDVAEMVPDRDITKRRRRDVARQGRHQKTSQRCRQTGTSPKDVAETSPDIGTLQRDITVNGGTIRRRTAQRDVTERHCRDVTTDESCRGTSPKDVAETSWAPEALGPR
ncbi:hypothetical protein EDC04DRAFT_2979588 [Pisolithus marmoratus]|nr:hypothetical protein EDC04DRAFT_2979588 [Pisolithus marmoratus]